MAATRTQPHNSLPAPVVHSGFPVSQSKSHVLAGVQDAYWSDDETVRVNVFWRLGAYLKYHTGGRRMSFMPGRNGYIGFEF